MIEMAHKQQTRTQIRLENLKPARDHYGVRVEAIRKLVPYDMWISGVLNWPQWDKLRILVCNVYGVSTIDQIPDEFIESANDFTIKMIDQMFDQNIIVVEFLKEKQTPKRHYIDDFVEDLNYKKIILKLGRIYKPRLEQRLKNDHLNKTHRLHPAKYLYVENCDFNGEEIDTQEDIDEMLAEGYVVYDLKHDEDDRYYYEI